MTRVARQLISIVMATYDRAALLPRAIDSVLAQDYPAWELIVVDDGSRDQTLSVLAGYRDPRVIVVRHEKNRGVTASKNTGFDHMRGEWFTVLDSDDEIVPDALSTMLAIADAHPDVDAVSCNCRDATTGLLCGSGLEHDGYVDLATLARLTGEHWGITRHSLLGSRRFDERIPGLEGVLWLKVSVKARRYYVHRALRIYHSEGQDRVSVRNEDRDRRLAMYAALAEDDEYLTLLERLDRERYATVVYFICLACVVAGRRGESWRFWRRYEGPRKRGVFLFASCALGPRWVKAAYAVRDAVVRGR